MSVRRIGVLLRKEMGQSSRNFMFIFAIVVPVVLSLVVSLLFGTLFSGKPKLGILDAGDSRIVTLLAQADYIVTHPYDSVEALVQATQTGAVDLGLVLPAGFDDRLARGVPSHIDLYVWGQSLLKSRAILSAALGNAFIAVAGREAPVEIVTTSLGDGVNVAWQDRLLPLIVLMTIIIGGSMLPATSIVDEKQKRTLRAVTTTSASLGEVFVAKGLLGVFISLVMGVLILVINQAFGVRPILLVGVLALAAIFAAAIGVLLGAYMKDINTLFATIKATGIVLYAPALLYIFPQVPQWIGKLFPTYYMIAPVVEITENGAGFAQIAWQLAVLVGLIVATTAVAGIVARQPEKVVA